jgi:hypothetical protein
MGEQTTETSVIPFLPVTTDKLPPVADAEEQNKVTVKNSRESESSITKRAILELDTKPTPADEILGEYYDKLQKVNYIQDLVALPFDGTVTPEVGKRYFSSNFQRIVWDPRFNPNKISDEDIANIGSKIHTLAEMYKNTCHKLGLPDDEYYVYESSTEGLKNIMENKKKLINLLKPGNYVAHGGYIDDLDQILKLKGLSSSVGRVNAGQIKETEIPRWGKFRPNHPDKSAVFFYPWTNPRAGSYSAPFGEAKGSTDMCFIYPTEDLIENSSAISISYFQNEENLEIGVTNSPTSIKADKLVSNDDDTTLLPFEKGFIVIPNDKLEEVQKTLLSNGSSNEWIKTHVKSIQIEKRTGRLGEKFNNLGEVIGAQKNEINGWLQQNHNPTDRKILISSRTGSLEGLFKAKFE